MEVDKEEGKSETKDSETQKESGSAGGDEAMDVDKPEEPEKKVKKKREPEPTSFRYK